MKAPRSYRYWLLSVLLLGILGYVDYAHFEKEIRLTAKTVPVKINPDCTVSPPDTVEVSIDDTLTWSPPNGDHVYSADFTDNTPFTPTIFSSVSVVRAGPPGQQVTGDFFCNKVSVGVSWLNKKYCYFPYNLIKDNGKKCSDPGVHVGPPRVSFVKFWE